MRKKHFKQHRRITAKRMRHPMAKAHLQPRHHNYFERLFLACGRWLGAKCDTTMEYLKKVWTKKYRRVMHVWHSI